MELPDFASDTKLNYLRRRIGAQYVEWDSKDKWRSLLEELVAKKEIDIDIAQDVVIGDDNTLEIQGRKVVAYIRDQHVNDPSEESKYKYHVANCRTIVEARSGRRLDGRYVASILENEDSIFVINKMRYGEMLRAGVKEKMDVCKNCLTTIDYQGYAAAQYSKKTRIFNSFTIKDFFEKYQKGTSVTIPRRGALDADINTYSEDFDKISRQLKKEAGHKCEECGQANDILHTHHIDGDKSNNSRRNLKVLCVFCHRMQPNHSHLH